MKKILSIVFLLCIYASTYAQPANDGPCGATVVTANYVTTLPSTCLPSTNYIWTGATISNTTPTPSCGNWGVGKNDVWYQIFIPVGVDSILINTLSGGGASPTTDAVMVLYAATACTGTFTQIACVDDVGASPMPLIKAAVPNTGVYYIRIFDYNPAIANGEIRICINLKQLHPTIDPTKRVGIGTANPEYNLDVNGTTKVRSDLTIDNITKTKDLTITNNVKIESGNPAIGKVLTSDGVGHATWQEKSSNGGVGFGSWGDCSMNNVSEYNPVVDATGAVYDNFGTSVCISGNYAIVGSHNDDVGANTDQGSASIYQLIGGSWVLMNKLIDANGAAGDYFGYSVSISGNYAIVGAVFDAVGSNVEQGSACIYQLIGGSWVLMNKITDASGAANDNFGSSVSISGNYAIVGAQSDNVGANVSQGSASIYQLTGGSWVLMNKLTDASGEANDLFGGSVSISGNYAIVGADDDNVGANINQGSASIYQLSGGNWVLMNKLTDASGAVNDYFGSCVSISGNYAIIGASSDDVGVNSNQGSASIYQLIGGNWVLMNKLTDASGAAVDYFGNSVSISGNYVVVGAFYKDIGANLNQGSASIFQRIGNGWKKVQHIIDPSGNAEDNFGSSVGFDEINKRFIIGAEGYGGGSGMVIFGKLNL